MTDRTLREVSRAEIADMIDRNVEKIASAEDPDFELARLIGISRLSKDARVYLAFCGQWREVSSISL